MMCKRNIVFFLQQFVASDQTLPAHHPSDTFPKPYSADDRFNQNLDIARVHRRGPVVHRKRFG